MNRTLYSRDVVLLGGLNSLPNSSLEKGIRAVPYFAAKNAIEPLFRSIVQRKKLCINYFFGILY